MRREAELWSIFLKIPSESKPKWRRKANGRLVSLPPKICHCVGVINIFWLDVQYMTKSVSVITVVKHLRKIGCLWVVNAMENAFLLYVLNIKAMFTYRYLKSISFVLALVQLRQTNSVPDSVLEKHRKSKLNFMSVGESEDVQAEAPKRFR